MKKIYLSVVIPTYNEEAVIKETLEKVLTFLKYKKYSYEIVITDDGSRDKTIKIAKELKKDQVRIVKLGMNRGKGGALRAGFLASSGKFILFTDADLSVPIKYADKILEKLESGADVAIGSRRIKGSKIIIHQPFLRELFGKVFTRLTQVMLWTNLADFTCGFKGFEAKAGKKIFSKGLLDRWAYDAEILFLAKKYGYKIVQVPIEWRNRAATRVNFQNAVITSSVDLLRIRFNDLMGKYEA